MIEHMQIIIPQYISRLFRKIPHNSFFGIRISNVDAI